jgi:hypothetical protein
MPPVGVYVCMPEHKSNLYAIGRAITDYFEMIDFLGRSLLLSYYFSIDIKQPKRKAVYNFYAYMLVLAKQEKIF